MRSLKDSRQLGIDSVKYLQGLSTEVHSDPHISAQILAAIKFGADWQLKASEKNYRNRQKKEIKEIKSIINDYPDMDISNKGKRMA